MARRRARRPCALVRAGRLTDAPFEVMASGRRIGPRHTLHDIRARARHELERLPTELRAVGPLVPYPVEVAASLEELAAVADRMTGPAEVQS